MARRGRPLQSPVMDGHHRIVRILDDQDRYGLLALYAKLKRSASELNEMQRAALARYQADERDFHAQVSAVCRKLGIDLTTQNVQFEDGIGSDGVVNPGRRGILLVSPGQQTPTEPAEEPVVGEEATPEAPAAEAEEEPVTV